MKTFKRYSSAKKAAGENPIIRIGRDCFVVGADRYIPIELIDGATGYITGTVTLQHLDRIGNGNWAQTPSGFSADRKRIWPDTK